MKVLTDTPTLFRAISDPSSLSPNARSALAELPFTASVANLWEMILKAGKASALVSDPVLWWDKYVVQSRIPALSIQNGHLRALAGLPNIHKDPFDRILVAQSLAERLTLLSKESTLAHYGAPVVW